MKEKNGKCQAQERCILGDVWLPKEWRRIARLIDRGAPFAPKQLYRYRSCSDRSFEALEKEELWFSKASKMNDDYDAMIPYDPDSLKKRIAKDYRKASKTLKKLKKNMEKGKLPQDSVTALLSEEVLDRVKKIKPEDLKERAEKGKMSTLKDVDNKFPLLAALLRESQKIACFSESITSPLLWGHYAENSTGFALEYDFRQGCYDEGNSDAEQILLPVVYAEKPFGPEKAAAEEYLYRFYHSQLVEQNGSMNEEQKERARRGLGDHDLHTEIRLLYRKSKEWKPEKEWRMLCRWRDRKIWLEDYYPLKKKPTALYLGRNISAGNEDRLRQIAGNLKIPVYKMKINHKTYKLEPILIQP